MARVPFTSPSIGNPSAPSVYSDTYTPAAPRYSSFFRSPYHSFFGGSPWKKTMALPEQRHLSGVTDWPSKRNMAQVSPQLSRTRSPTFTRSVIEDQAYPKHDRSLSVMSYEDRPLSMISYHNPLGDHPVIGDDYREVIAESVTGDLPRDFYSHPNTAIEPERQRRHRRRREPRPDRYCLGCIPVSDFKIKVKLFHAVVSFFILSTITIIFASLAGRTNIFSQDFRIVAILLIIFFTVIFFHSSIRLGMLIKRHQRKKAKHSGKRTPSPFGPVSVPDEPIRVVLARDEELGLTEDVLEPVKDLPRPLPPMYGLWRGSTRADPNFLHWQRVENATPLSVSDTVNQPPTYVSEQPAELGLGPRGAHGRWVVQTRPPPNHF